jgi:hypothetical protein
MMDKQPPESEDPGGQEFLFNSRYSFPSGLRVISNLKITDDNQESQAHGFASSSEQFPL